MANSRSLLVGLLLGTVVTAGCRSFMGTPKPKKQDGSFSCGEHYYPTEVDRKVLRGLEPAGKGGHDHAH